MNSRRIHRNVLILRFLYVRSLTLKYWTSTGWFLQ